MLARFLDLQIELRFGLVWFGLVWFGLVWFGFKQYFFSLGLL